LGFRLGIELGLKLGIELGFRLGIELRLKLGIELGFRFNHNFVLLASTNTNSEADPNLKGKLCPNTNPETQS
jgi:hypothetical protein